MRVTANFRASSGSDSTTNSTNCAEPVIPRADGIAMSVCQTRRDSGMAWDVIPTTVGCPVRTVLARAWFNALTAGVSSGLGTACATTAFGGQSPRPPKPRVSAM